MIRAQKDNWSQLPNFSCLNRNRRESIVSNDALDVTIKEQSAGHSDQDGHHRDPEHRQKDLADWSLATGSVRGERKSENNKYSLMHTTLQQQIIESSFKQTKPHTNHSVSSAVHWPGATRRHTQTRGEQKLCVSDAGAAVKYYPAQSFKGETIKKG